MPYSENETPERLKGKGIPAQFVRMFVHVWNSVYEKTHDEERAFKAAYSSMGAALRKAGYTHDEGGKWHKEEAMMEPLLEGWLPAGTSQNDLDDGDFAWLSNAYTSALAEERAGMNRREHRKLPYKIHGKVNKEGWKAAWKAAAHPGARHPSFEGGPSQSAVLAKLRRNKPKGIVLNKDDTFADTEGAEGTPVTLAAISKPLQVLEGDGEAGLRVAGVALVDEVISRNGNYYSQLFNTRCMERTNRAMAEEGHVVTVFSRHGKALPGPAGFPLGLPVGKIDKPLWRDGREVWYEAFIAPTAEGKDVATLIRTGVMFKTSIRAKDFVTETKQMPDGQYVEELQDALIAGVDLTDEAGIQGAGIRTILEEIPVLSDPAEHEPEEDNMEWEKVTLEELVAERQDLLDGYVATLIDSQALVKPEQNESALEELNTNMLALTEELQKAKALAEERGLALDAEKQRADTEALARKVAEASLVGLIPSVLHDTLKAKVKTEEDIATFLAESREQAIITATSRMAGDVTSTKGRTVPDASDPETVDGEEPEEQLTEEARRILQSAGYRSQ